MKKKLLNSIIPFCFALGALTFTACDNSNADTDGEVDVYTDPDHPALNPDTIMHDTGTTGGQMNEGDPSSPNNNTQQDNMNSNGTKNGEEKGSSGGNGALYEPGPTKDDFEVDYQDNKTTRDYNKGMDTKNNGVREPNEYPSGRAGGQYANPNSTTTKSGADLKENPATGSPSKSD